MYGHLQNYMMMHVVVFTYSYLSSTSEVLMLPSHSDRARHMATRLELSGTCVVVIAASYSGSCCSYMCECLGLKTLALSLRLLKVLTDLQASEDKTAKAEWLCAFRPRNRTQQRARVLRLDLGWTAFGS